MAAKRCKKAAGGSETREAQAFQAYMFLASRRDSERLTATVSNTEAAAHVLRNDGGTIKESSYRRYTKNDLRRCGLVDFTRGKGGREAATVYTFPAFMELYGLVDNPWITNPETHTPCTGQPVQNTHDLYGLTSTKHAQNVLSIELLEGRYMGMEEGYNQYTPGSPLPTVDNQPSKYAGVGGGQPLESYCPKCKKTALFQNMGFNDGIQQSVYRCEHCGFETFL